MDFERPEDKQGQADFRGSLSGYEHDVCFVRAPTAGKPFVEAGYVLGLDFDHDGRAVAPLDIDGDGDQDLAVLSLQGLQLLQNDSPPGARFARVRLQATRSEPLALGAVVRLTADKRSQTDRVRLAEGFQTQTSTTLHFGLGDARAVDGVDVTWPSGAAEHFGGVALDRLNTLVEGRGEAVAALIPQWDEAVRPKGRSTASVLVTALDREGVTRPLGRLGRPTVVNFFAPWCEPCKRELPALAAFAARRPDVDVVGVSVETKDLTGVLAFADAHALRYPVAFANDRVIESFFGPGGKVPLPATFVFDEKGQLRRAFLHTVDGSEIERAVDTRRTPPSVVDYRQIIVDLLQSGRNDEAALLLEEALQRTPDDSFTLVRLAELQLHMQQVDRAQVLLKRALAKQPDNVRALAVYGETLGVKKDLDGAERYLLRAIRVAPDDPTALNNLGMVYARRGDWTAARDAFARAVEAGPTFARARQNLLDAERMLRGEGPPAQPDKLPSAPPGPEEH